MKALPILIAAVSGVLLGQVKTHVPEVVVGARPAIVERIKIHGPALEGNLEGNAVDRDALVFLPPGYNQNRTRRRYRAIAIDVGDQDGLRADSAKLRDALTNYGIAHDFEIYSGTHTSHVAVRFQEHVLPFFSRTLWFEPANDDNFEGQLGGGM